MCCPSYKVLISQEGKDLIGMLNFTSEEGNITYWDLYCNLIKMPYHNFFSGVFWDLFQVFTKGLIIIDALFKLFLSR